MTTRSPATSNARARLRDHQELRDALHFRRMTVLELAVACGNPKYRHTLSHLHAGTRNTCTVHLARRIQEALNLHKSSLFDLYIPGSNAESQATRGRQAA